VVAEVERDDYRRDSTPRDACAARWWVRGNQVSFAGGDPLSAHEEDDKGAVAELARGLGLDLLSPAARESEETRSVPERVWKTLFESGLVAPIPEVLGGGGVPDTHTQMIAVENFAYGDAGIALAAVWCGGACALLTQHGTAEQQSRGVALAASPSARASLALFEGFGRAPSEFATTITQDGAEQVRVEGRKVGVAFATAADPLIVVGRDSRTHALCAVLVPQATAGAVVSGDRPGLALNAANTATVTFDASVPTGNLLGRRDDDPQMLSDAIGRVRLATAAAQVGTAQRAVDHAADYATQRVAFDKPIASFQGISFPLADAQTQIQQARLEVAEAAELLDSAASTPQIDKEAVVSRAVSYATEIATEATRTAVQTLGGHGFIVDHPVERWFRTAAALSAFDFDPVRTPFRPAL
jgi:alkylation response protein AidB-like acyl-CoA dehydrogenase